MDSSLFGYSLDDFKEEAGELLARAEAVLSDINESPGDPNHINALFRSIHSLKGSAAYAGLSAVNSFAHLYESFLGDLRNGERDVTSEIRNVLVRAKDYLEDLIFSPDNTELPRIDESITDHLERLRKALIDKKTAREVAGVGSAEEAADDSRQEKKREAGAPESSTGKVPAHEIKLKTVDFAEMDQSDVIKVTIVKGMKALAACLKENEPDREILLKVLTKLEDTILWAFGEDAPDAARELKIIKDAASGSIGSEEIAELRKSFNALLKVLKEGILSLDGSPDNMARGAETEEEKRTATDDMRRATEDEIVKITVKKTLERFAAILDEENPDADNLKNTLNKLKDLNGWAFNDDENLKNSLNSMEDLLLRPYNETVARNLKLRYSVAESIFASLLGEKNHERSGDRSAEAHGTIGEGRVRTGMGKAGALRSTLSGPSLRVRSQDLESLMSTVGDLTGLEPAEFERLQTQALQLRMVPVGELFNRFKKVIRDLSEELGKDIDLVISGESVRLDKVIADKLQEPLLHLVRNAASHGLENPEELKESGKDAGIISLNAYQTSGQIIIEVNDNGRGISVERIRKRGIELGLVGAQENDVSEKDILDLIFTPGFSTKKEADEISGRGVGMDVVKEIVTSMQGSITIDTEVGRGTTISLVLPLTLAIVNALILEKSDGRIAVPAASVERVVSMTQDEVGKNTFMDKDRLSIDLKEEGEVFPLVNLSEFFEEKGRKNKCCIVLVRTGSRRKVALAVDSALARRPLTVKPLDRFAENRYFSSASLVDNDIVFVLNVPSLSAA